jgi:hypothetical protein
MHTSLSMGQRVTELRSLMTADNTMKYCCTDHSEITRVCSPSVICLCACNAVCNKLIGPSSMAIAHVT